LKKAEGDCQNSITELEKRLFDVERNRVERETILRYKMHFSNMQVTYDVRHDQKVPRLHIFLNDKNIYLLFHAVCLRLDVTT
jgi:hypothetical protein